MIGKPFVKWAGGKTQLIKKISESFPKGIKKSTYTYIEPFVGGGAVLFHILNNYPNIEKIVINDINSDLINTYKTIKNNVEELIEVLQKWEIEFHGLLNDDGTKKKYYYEKRNLFNSRQSDKTTQAALFIFLNKTCFNGLFRVNRKNEFNVPIGGYKRPMICDRDNLLAVNSLLQKVIVLNDDFEKTLKEAQVNTIFYLDPPYKPLNQTSSFNSYSKDEFNDDEQIRLAKFCEKIDQLGHKWILSNSDVKGKNPNDDFFDDLYKKYNIDRVLAKRSINANPEKRGELTELLITNQPKEYVKII
ncbi:MAG: DNA adenine methylase [Chitinophagales bacterium]